MGTEMVFSGGERVKVIGTDASTLVQTLERGRKEPTRVPATGDTLAPGWIDIQAESGVILVNPAQVAYIRDVPEPSTVEYVIG